MNQSSDKQLLEIIEKYLRNIATGKPIEKENLELIEKKKQFIRNIILLLAISPEIYEPKTVLQALKKYIDENGDYQRFLYSEITIFLYSLSKDKKANIDSNLNSLIEYLSDKSVKQLYNNEQLETLKYVILKLYDHIALAEFQVDQMHVAADEAKQDVIKAVKEKTELLQKQFDDTVKDEKSKALEELGRKMSEESRNSQRGYVATLGIFSAIMLAAFTSLAVAKDAVPLISGDLSRFLLVFCLVGSFIIILVQMLLNAIFAISDKYEEFKQSFLGHIGAYLVVLWIVFLVLLYVTA